MRRVAVLLALLAGTAHAQEDETLKGLDRCFAISRTANQICESSTADTDSRMACLKKVLKEQQDCLDRVQVGGRLPPPTKIPETAAAARPDGTTPAPTLPKRQDPGKTKLRPARPTALPGPSPGPPAVDGPADAATAPRTPDQATEDQATREQAAGERAAREAAETAARERAARERAAREAAEQAAREQASREQVAREAAEQATRERAAREAAEQAAREQATREAAEKAANEQAAGERAAREQAAREPAARDRDAAKEGAVKQAKGEAGRMEQGEERPSDVTGASAWTVSDTRSPVDYSPVVAAELASSSAPVALAPAELVIRCRGMRTELSVRTHEAWRPARSGDVEVAFAPEGGQVQRFRWPLAPGGRSAGPAVDAAAILRALPAARTEVTVTDGTGSAAISAFDLSGLDPVRARIAAACARSAGTGSRRR